MGLPAIKLEKADLPHYKYEDYKQWEGKWEIIKGIPFAMVPAPAIRHQDIAFEIAVQLREQLKQCGTHHCRVHLPIDWQIADDTVVQPDVMVVCGDNSDPQKLTITPVLVVEVLSPSTRRKDRVLKYQLYQAAGVKYYCMVDPRLNSIEVLQLKDKLFHAENDFKDGKIRFEIGKCILALNFKEIFNLA